MSKEKNANNIAPAKKAKEISEFYNLIDRMILTLPERSRDIIKKRFGIVEDGTQHTLEKIGKDYKITRERIRQIIADAIKTICKSEHKDDFHKAEDEVVFAIEKNGGIIKEIDAIKKLNPDGLKEENAIRFFVACSERIKVKFENGRVEKSWISDEAVMDRFGRVEKEAKLILTEKNKPLKDEEIITHLFEKMPDFSKEHIMSHLSVMSQVKRNVFGKWGHHTWMDIRPKGSKERIHLVLKEEGKPLHFTEIAKLIDKYGLGKKKSHPQTVHNELIKDDRFVLIGRGIYALRDWGYYEGTIKDVISNILEKSGRLMKREEIMEEVLKIRKVKKTTIMINLNNPKFFKKNGELYSLNR